MARNFGANLRQVLQAWRSDDPVIILAMLTHAQLALPIRVANNTQDIVSNGETFIGFPFRISIPSENDGPPKGQMEIQNVDRRIGNAIIGLVDPVNVQLSVVLASDPDTVWLQFDHFYLRNITGDAMLITGDIDTFNMSDEPWPGRRATKNRFPGVFR